MLNENTVNRVKVCNILSSAKRVPQTTENNTSSWPTVLSLENYILNWSILLKKKKLKTEIMGFLDQLSIGSLFKDVQRMDKRQVRKMILRFFFSFFVNT